MMLKIEQTELKKSLDLHLQRQLVSGKVILDRFCVIDETSRRSPAYLDPNFSGFYYHLSKYVQPDSVLEIGFDLGLLSGSFMLACPSVRRFLGFRESRNEFASTRLGRRNIRKAMRGERRFYVGKLYDAHFEDLLIGGWDCVLLTEEGSFDHTLEYLDFIWPVLNENGIIVCEYLDKNRPAKDAFKAFCESKNRQPLLFGTRYGTGLVQK